MEVRTASGLPGLEGSGAVLSRVGRCHGFRLLGCVKMAIGQSSQEEEVSEYDPRGWEAPLTRQHSGWWPLIRSSIFPRVSAGCMSAPFAESSSSPLNRLAGFRLLGPSTPSAAFRCAQVLSPRPSLTTCRICWCSSFGGVPWIGPPSSVFVSISACVGEGCC